MFVVVLLFLFEIYDTFFSLKLFSFFCPIVSFLQAAKRSWENPF